MGFDMGRYLALVSSKGDVIAATEVCDMDGPDALPMARQNLLTRLCERADLQIVELTKRPDKLARRKRMA